MKLLVVTAILLAFAESLFIEEDIEAFQKGLAEAFEYGSISEEFAQLLRRNQLPYLFNNNAENKIKDPILCSVCQGALITAADFIRSNPNRTLIETIAVDVCVNYGLASEHVCEGAIDINIDIFLYIINNMEVLPTKDICGIFLANSGCTTDFDWSVNIDSGVPNDPKIPILNGDKIGIIHFSDFHIDLNYTIGGNADCGEPVCCRPNQGEPSNSENACGYWTDYRHGDTPWHLIEETVRQALETQPQIDLVYYTGDFMGHSFWELTVDDNIQLIKQLFDFFKTKFNVPVIPVLGNHDTTPLNAFAPTTVNNSDLSETWLYELIADEWESWLGNDVRETLLKGGYYTVTPFEGFRIIVLNNNVCMSGNWWLFWSVDEDFDQLQWLADTLKLAEDRNESVHLLYHAHGGTTECLLVWQREFHKIISRFSNIITGHLNGHTHKDELKLFYNESDPSQAIGVVYNGASLTTYTDSNPSYKYYTVDRTTFHLLDYEEWTFNLTEANLAYDATPNWYKLYSFVEYYGVSDLRPENANLALENMIKNHSLFQDYIRFKYRNSDPGVQQAANCDENCQKQELCTITTTQPTDTGPCEYYQNMYDDNNIKIK